MGYVFERMSAEHREAVIDILNAFISKSFAAYGEEPVGYDFFDELLDESCGYPSLVVRDSSSGIVGFAFMHANHAAIALNSQAVITYFIMPDHTRKGAWHQHPRKICPGVQKTGTGKYIGERFITKSTKRLLSPEKRISRMRTVL
jgi:L-amino acid N-acyltransferase YncA